MIFCVCELPLAASPLSKLGCSPHRRLHACRRMFVAVALSPSSCSTAFASMPFARTMPLMGLLDDLCLLMRDQFLLQLPPSTLHLAGVHSRQCVPVPCVFADRSASATDEQRRPESSIVSTASDSVFTAAGACYAMYF